MESFLSRLVYIFVVVDFVVVVVVSFCFVFVAVAAFTVLVAFWSHCPPDLLCKV